MLAGIKKIAVYSLFVLMTLSGCSVTKVEAIEETNRNLQFAPSEYSIPAVNATAKGYVKIFENRNFEYFFNTVKSVLKIRNKNTGYMWSTGADSPIRNEIEDSCTNILPYSSEYYACSIDPGPNGNGNITETVLSEINQMIGISFLDGNTDLKQTEVRTLRKDTASVGFYQHVDKPNEWMYKVDTYLFTNTAQVEYRLSVNMRITFTEDGLKVNIKDSDISGNGRAYVESVSPLPFLGQSGGKLIQCVIEEVDENGRGDCTWPRNSERINNDTTNVPGYVFVPDGSGALIRFDDIKYYNTNVYFDMYGDPYRTNYTDIETSFKFSPEYVNYKQIMMPVWGVAHGNQQDAFVAYVTSGDEYFGLLFNGRTSAIQYSSIIPRFEFNRRYNYTFGSRTTTLILEGNELPHYDIGIDYVFLAGDGSEGNPPADYVGMALVYRDYLLENDLVKVNEDLSFGPRVDFLIADAKNGIFSYEEVSLTSIDEIEYMLNDLYNSGIRDINATLKGWQNMGIYKAKPFTAEYNKAAGGKSGFKDLIKLSNDLGYNINFYQDYGLINSEQFSNVGAYVVKHLDREYGSYRLNNMAIPFSWFHYVNPNYSMSWLNTQANLLKELSSDIGITMAGVNTELVPDYSKNYSYSDAREIMVNGTAQASEKLRLSAATPNMYLWKHLTDYYDIPVYNSQFNVETDSVPFMEVVLSGLANMYAQYANFSFYDNMSVLRMIDYNLNPSFILTREEREEITYTNSAEYFSTGYVQYKDVVIEVTNRIRPFLEATSGMTLVNKEAVLSEEITELGVYVNTYANYENGAFDPENTVKIVINYTDKTIVYNGVSVEPVSAKVL